MKYSLILLLGITSCARSVSDKSEPLILVEDSITHSFGYQDVQGKVIIPFGKYTMCFTDTFRTHAIVAIGGDWGVIDRQENKLYEVFPFDNGPDYPAEGLFRIVKNGKIGYADAATYAIVIPPQFDCGYPFENGTAKVSHYCTTQSDGEHKLWTSDNWVYIDKKGGISAAPK